MNDQVDAVVPDRRQATVLIALMCLSSVALFAILPHLALYYKGLTRSTPSVGIGLLATYAID